MYINLKTWLSKEVGIIGNVLCWNIRTFKKFCMKADTKKADNILDYYMKMEEILHEHTSEIAKQYKEDLAQTKKELVKYKEIT